MDVQLTHGRDDAGRLRHILEVPNGLACGCTCPGCGAPLVAKNQGANVNPHFAHASGTACKGAHESELHLLAKEILASEKALMLPAYGNIYEGGMVRFAGMEVEERHECPMLQPDLVGLQQNPRTGETGRLWIEIRVTHEVGTEKYEKIKELGVSCIEIDLSMYKDLEVSRKNLSDFLLHDSSHRQWINNPRLETRMKELARQRRAYAQQMAILQQERPDARRAQEGQKGQTVTGLKVVKREKCERCPHHSTRQAIIQEMLRYKFPAEWRNIIMHHPLKWFSSSLITPLPTRPSDYLMTIGNDTLLLATSSPDIYGNPVNEARLQQNKRAVNFFSHTLPHMISTLGTKCSHTGQYIPSVDDTLQVECKRNQETPKE